MRSRCPTWWAVWLAVVAALGCSSSGPEMVPIRGEVWYDGALLRDVTQGIVRYTPKDSGTAAREATGRIQPDGTFELTTKTKGDGVAHGNYVVTVSAYSNPPLTREQTEAGMRGSTRQRIIPERYENASTSGLSDVVDDDHSGFKKIELTKQ